MTGIVKAELGFVSPVLLLGFQTINGEKISGTDIAFAVLPGIGKIDDLSGVVNGLDDAVNTGKQATGQMHHILSNSIMRVVNRHPTLSGNISRNSLVVRAIDKASHYGYQTWHRVSDINVVKWLEVSENQSASVNEFMNYLQKIYSESDMSARFPDAIKTIQKLVEQ